MRFRNRARPIIALAVLGLLSQAERSAIFAVGPQSGALTAIYHTNTGGKTQIIVKGTSSVQYSVESVQERAIWINFLGVTAATLLSSYRIGSDTVSSVDVINGRGSEGGTKLKINLTQAAEVNPVVRDNLLILSITPKRASFGTKLNAGAATAVKSISYRTDASGVRASIETNGKPDYEAFVTPDSNRIVVDVKGTEDQVPRNLYAVGSSNLQTIKVGQYRSVDPKITRVVFELQKAAAYTITADQNTILVNINEVPPAATSETKSESALAAATPAQATLQGIQAVDQTLLPPPPSPQPQQDSAAGTVKETADKPSTPSTSDATEPSSQQKATRGEPVLHRQTPPVEPAQAQHAPAPSPKPTAAAGTQKSSQSTKTRRAEEVHNSEGSQGAGITVHITGGDTGNAARPVTYDVGGKQDEQKPQSGFGGPGYVGDPISLDLKQIDIRDVARYISSTYGVNFIFDKSVNQVPVTISINEVPWNQVLEAILRANDLATTVEGSLIRVVTSARLEQEETQKKKLRDARILAEPLKTKLIRLQYAQVDPGGSGQSGNRPSSSETSDTGGAASTGGGGGNAGLGIRAVVMSRLSQRGRVEVDPRTNTLIVTDVEEHLKAVEEIVGLLDRPERQVEIECRIVRVNHDFSRDLGVQLNGLSTNPHRGTAGGISTLQPPPGQTPNPTIGPQPLTNLLAGIPGAPTVHGTLGAAAASTVLGLTTGVFGTNAITTLLTAAEQRGSANIISSPRVTAQNNRVAEIERGIRIPVQTLSNNTVSTIFVTAALRLQIQPQITDNGEVVLHVVAENDAPDFSRSVLGIPTIATQRAESLVRLPDGGTTIFGGISVDSDSRTEYRTPGLGKIPIIGELFKRRETGRSSDEILFFLTPRIFKPELVGLQDLLPTAKEEKKDK